MLRRFIDLFQLPVSADAEKGVQARILHRILLGALVLTILFLVYTILLPPRILVLVAVGAVVLEFLLLGMLQEGRISLASSILTGFLWVAVTISIVLYGGIRDTGYMAYIAVLVIAGFTLSGRMTLLYTGLTLLATLSLALLESAGLLPAYQPVPLGSVVISHAVILLAVALILDLTVRSISGVARLATESVAQQQAIQAQLDQSMGVLAGQKAELEARNKTLGIVAELSRQAAGTASETQLLDLTVGLLSGRLGLEFCNLYLTGQSRQNAFLAAANSPAGRSLLESQAALDMEVADTPYRLAQSNTLRYQVGTHYYFISPPALLPGARSSLCLPLVVGSELLGLANIQAAGELEASTLQDLVQPVVDQLAIQIANGRTLQALREQLAALSRTTGQGRDDAWDRIDRYGTVGFQYDQVNILEIDEQLPEAVADKLATGQVQDFLTGGEVPRSRLVAPILSRGEVVGIIGYEQERDHLWLQEERTLLETIAARVSLALENTRLVADAQKRADRERKISLTATRMRETLDIDTVLQTAVREIRRSLSAKQAEIRLNPLADSTNLSDLVVKERR